MVGDRKLAFEPSSGVKEYENKSGLIQSFISASVKNLSPSSVYSIFSSPEKLTLNTTSSIYSLFSSPEKLTLSLSSTYSVSVA